MVKFALHFQRGAIACGMFVCIPLFYIAVCTTLGRLNVSDGLFLSIHCIDSLEQQIKTAFANPTTASPARHYTASPAYVFENVRFPPLSRVRADIPL